MSTPRGDLIVVAALIGITFTVYANALSGEFVYDDRHQILENHLIQSNDRLLEALTSDVWAFKGGDAARSNYWRPLFVAWLALNERLFGLERPAAWHAAALLLHAAACLIGYGLLRRLRVQRAVATAAALLFCIHPAQVESVAWISGAPNALSATAAFGSLWLAVAAIDRPSAWKWSASLALFALALLAKETSLLLPIVVYALAAGAGDCTACGPLRDPAEPAARAGRGTGSGPKGGRAVRVALPYAILALLFLAARHAVLGRHQVDMPWRHDLATILLTLPSVVAFYLRQIVLPYEMSPAYPVRVVSPAAASATKVLIPLATVVGAAALIFLAARGGRARRLGVLLALLPLLPALNIGAFLPEQIVHDRYLYLPVFGFSLLVLASAASLVEARFGLDPRRAAHAVLTGAAIIGVPLAAATISYNRVWQDELSLWERATEVDPVSSFNQSEYARALRLAGRPEQAKRAAERAIAVMPNQFAMTERAILALGENRLRDAERDLRWVIENTPAQLPAYEQLAGCLQRQGRVVEAIDVLRLARERIPEARTRISTNLAVALYLAGRRDEALAELEANRAAAAREPSAEAKRSLYLLGKLYAETGRAGDARAALGEYLAATEGLRDPESVNLRGDAQRTIGALR